MTNTPTNTEAPPETLHPSAMLMSLIIALLAPMFLCVTAGDIGLARAAATQTVNAYRARSHADLIAVAQIVAFGLAALGSLSLSMADDISLPMALRLRANANACGRSAEQNRRALAQSETGDRPTHRPDTPATPEIPPTFPECDTPADAGAFLSAAAARELAAESQARLQRPEPPPKPAAPKASSEKRHQAMWAITMVKESGEISASIPHLPPAEREAATRRAAALSSTAHDLLQGALMPPLTPSSLAGITPPNLAGPPTQQ
jgi:hypothetical protein